MSNKDLRFELDGTENKPMQNTTTSNTVVLLS